MDEREASDRTYSEDREITEGERLEFFRDSLQQSVLPDLPPIPGYHLCWLSTTNPRDTIAWRMRLGYTLIRVEDLPGWNGGSSTKVGDISGVISINEMVAAKLPLRLYNQYMKEVGEVMPRSEEEKLRAKQNSAKQQLEAVGSAIVEEGDGTASLANRAPPMPEFTA
jgi:hypothetical protein